jgi:predicted RNA-binding Zn-ribbon protein involved in translation (DUF1610 family)
VPPRPAPGALPCPSAVPYPDHQLWALAVGAPIIRIEGYDVGLLGGRRHDDPQSVGWCRYALKTLYGIESRPQLESSLKYFLQEGDSAAARAMLKELGPDPSRDDYPHGLVRAQRAAIERSGLFAWDAARAVAITGWGFWAGLFQEMECWQIIMVAAARAQRAYDSWRALADGYELGRLFWSKGARDDKAAVALRSLLDDPQSPWRRLPWGFDLGVTLFDGPTAKTRFKRTVCPTCGAPKSRPSVTAYVYCDFCGALSDFDFAKACEKPLERPGPVYVGLLGRLQSSLDAALGRGDVAGYRQLQLQLFDSYIDAAPNSSPPRVRDPAYRAKYVAWLAEGAVVRAFDPVSKQHEAAVAQATRGLAFAQVKPGVLRVASDAWERLLAAIWPQQDHDARLFDTHGIWKLHPDGAASELQRRVGMSMFVQGWLPMLDEHHAQALVERVGLKSEYVESEAPKGDASTCGSCGAAAVVLQGARQMVCEHCGRKLDVTGEKIACPGCGASLAPPEGAGQFNCPHCRAAVQRVQMMRPA